MFTQCVVLATLIVATLSDFTIHQEGHQHECTNLICPKGAFEEVEHSLMKDKKEQQCTLCSQCTNFGYSVCAQPLSKALRFRRELDEDHCTCANFVPEKCKTSQFSSTTKKDANSQVFRICYLSTLRTPPKVLGLNDSKKKVVSVTIEEFWQDKYWKDFELNNMTLFYKFEVKSPEHCEGLGNLTTINDSSPPLHICTSSLRINMEENTPEPKETHDPTDSDDQYTDEDRDEDEGRKDDGPPAVDFERDVFVDAKFVELWYTVTVHRPRQLSFGERPFHDVATVVASETLRHTLEPWNYGADDDESDDSQSQTDVSKSGHDSVSKVNIEPNIDDEDDDDDSDEDKTDPIPSDNPGIIDKNYSIEETEPNPEMQGSDEKDSEEETTDEPEEPVEGDDNGTEETTEDPDDDNDVDTETEEKKTLIDASQEVVSQEIEVPETTTPTTSEAPTEETTEGEDEVVPTLEDDASYGNETSPFLPSYLAHWPMMRVTFVLVGIASIILIAAACCYRYRGCCCYSDQQKVVTKTSNGYEYHVTGQSGQEMVGPPETQKLTQ